jgi:hypothetical protein
MIPVHEIFFDKFIIQKDPKILSRLHSVEDPYVGGFAFLPKTLSQASSDINVVEGMENFYLFIFNQYLRYFDIDLCIP